MSLETAKANPSVSVTNPPTTPSSVIDVPTNEIQSSGNLNKSIKIFIFNYKDQKYKICAILSDICPNISCGQNGDPFYFTDYETVRRNHFNNGNQLVVDVLIYGNWRRYENLLDIEILVNKQFPVTDDSKHVVYGISRFLIELMNVKVKWISEKHIFFCAECSVKISNEEAFKTHAIDYHRWNLKEENEENKADAYMLQAGVEQSSHCFLSKFRRVDWLDAVDPTILPSKYDHSLSRRDTESSQSPSSLSTLPSWATATSPCAAVCTTCDTIFPSSFELEDHIKLSHQRVTTPTNRSNTRPQISREYRCNICNYKTGTKGNLHIHFQSEKHRNNQKEHDQNEHKSHFQHQDSTPLPSLRTIPQLQLIDNLLSRPPNELFSNVKVNMFPTNWSSPVSNHNKSKNSMVPNVSLDNNITVFECDICHNFSHSDMDSILDHAERPRALPNNVEVSKVIRVNSDNSSLSELEHVCLLDGYKTRIKANFLLHFKTEKHQQKLQLLAHAREGGSENANKVMVQMVAEPTSLVSIRCNLCRSTFSTAHKLRLHVDSSDHQINQKIASSLQIWQKSLESSNQSIKDDQSITGFECKPCGSIFRRYVDILDHFHAQKNTIHATVFKKDVDMNSLVKIHYQGKSDKTDYYPDVNTERGTNDATDSVASPMFRCNFCNDPVDRRDFRIHLKEIHKIKENCIDQVISMACQAHLEHSLKSNSKGIVSLLVSDHPNDWCDCVIIKETDTFEPMVRCQQCGKCFSTVYLLEEHKCLARHNETQDSRGHLCYKKGCNQYFKSIALMVDHFYEIHAFQIPEYKRLENFKHVCKICHLLAFSCPLKLSYHMNLHTKFGEYDCLICGLSIDNRSSLQMHIEGYHMSIKNDESLKENVDSRRSREFTSKVSPPIAELQSSFSSPDSIVNKENRNHYLGIFQKPSEEDFLKRVESDSSLPYSWPSIASLIQNVGLENVKLVIETMINSKFDQNEKDAFVWKYAKSIINIANIKETLTEKCLECGKYFSCEAVLNKHLEICVNHNTDKMTEFERILCNCKEHLTRMMIYSNDPNKKSPFGAMNSLSNSSLHDDASLVGSSLMFRTKSDDSQALISGKLPSSNLLSLNRSLIPPILNPYRFPPTNPTLPCFMPPLGTFPLTRFGLNNLPFTSPSFGFYNPKSAIHPTNPSAIINHSDSNKSSDHSNKSEGINRKRTQIKNHQYEILRSYFNINNPPNDEVITEIIAKTGLDRKTVKHWFRNTLFKERQKCKDSPYNFSIPPETSLNLEEYEKTGKIEIKSQMSLSGDMEKMSEKCCEDSNEIDITDEMKSYSPPEKKSKIELCHLQPKIEYNNSNSIHEENVCVSPQNLHFDDQDDSRFIMKQYRSSIEESLSRNDCNSSSNSSQIDETPLDLSYPNSGLSLTNGARNSFSFDPISPFESEHETNDNSNSNCGERRHRTTLTSMQIQAMKSIFIHCRSPTHSELGSLGNVLSLDMRVVQVWFQNQRAKLKKQERDVFYRDKPVFPEAIPSIVELPKCDRIHCLVCSQNVSPGLSKQSHLFSNSHLTMLMRYLVTKSNDFKLNWKSASESNAL